MRMPAQSVATMRRPAPYSVQRRAIVKSFAAPLGGWVANRSLAQPNAQGLPAAAALLENWFPTATGVRMRRGSQLYATLGDGTLPVTTLFSYKNGNQEKLFGATDNAIYDVTTITFPYNYTLGTEIEDTIVTNLGDTFGENSTIGKEALTGTTGGDWVVTQFGTDGGTYLIGVNGVDDGFIYDGTEFSPSVAGGVWKLNFDSKTAPFTVGEVVTGAISGASGTIFRQLDEGLTGSLTVKDITFGPSRNVLDLASVGAPFTASSILTGSLSGATATIDVVRDDALWLSAINDGPTRKALKTRDVETDFTKGATLTGQTSLATATIDEILEDGTLWLSNIVTKDIKWNLPFRNQTANFTVGATITGAVSGATAVINDITDNGTDGTLWLINKSDENFYSGERITGSSGGSADTAGFITYVSGGDFRNGEELNDSSDGEGFASGVVTDTGPLTFMDGEEVTDANGGNGITAGTVRTVDNIFFLDGEVINGSIGGSATIDGDPVIVMAGITFPEGSTLTTADFTYEWAYKNRLFFIEKESLDAWYLPTNAIAGEVVKFPLAGVFALGGSLIFGANWSLDSGSGGSGLSQQCIFVTTEGEVAVYQGTNPASATDWAIVGVYRIGKPLGKRAHIRAGGDIVIATDIGFVPLSQAIQRDYAALSPSAVSYTIEDEWNKAVAVRSGSEWRCDVWPNEQMVIVALPTVNEETPTWFVANARTGAWGEFTGWDATAIEIFKGRCFFGSQNGKIIEANVTGADEGKPYTSSLMPLFEDLGSPTSLKTTSMARAVMRGNTEPLERLSIQVEYEINLPSPPSAAPVSISSVWGGGIWGQSKWGEEQTTTTYQTWRVVSGTAYSLSPALQITSGSIRPLDIELIRLDLSFETADAIT